MIYGDKEERWPPQLNVYKLVDKIIEICRREKCIEVVFDTTKSALLIERLRFEGITAWADEKTFGTINPSFYFIRKEDEIMNWFELLTLFLKNLPPAVQTKLFGVYHQYKALLERMDGLIKAITPDEAEGVILVSVHKELANLFLHNVLKIAKEANWYTREAFDVALPLAMHLFNLPADWKPDWWDESYYALDA